MFLPPFFSPLSFFLTPFLPPSLPDFFCRFACLLLPSVLICHPPLSLLLNKIFRCSSRSPRSSSRLLCSLSPTCARCLFALSFVLCTVWDLRLHVALFSLKKVCCCGCCCCCSSLFCEASSHEDARFKALLQARSYTRSRSRTQTCTRTRTRTKPKLTRTRKTMRTCARVLLTHNIKARKRRQRAAEENGEIKQRRQTAEIDGGKRR